jgi:hypothetical protein
MFETLLSKIKIKYWLVFTLLHFILSSAAFLWSFSVTSKVFDGREVSIIALNVPKVLFDILLFPLSAVIHSFSLPGLWGWLPILVNSLLWGFAISIIISWLRK